MKNIKTQHLNPLKTTLKPDEKSLWKNTKNVVQLYNQPLAPLTPWLGTGTNRSDGRSTLRAKTMQRIAQQLVSKWAYESQLEPGMRISVGLYPALAIH